MKGAISWGGGLDQLTGLHTAQADITLGGHSFPRYGSMQVGAWLGLLGSWHMKPGARVLARCMWS